MTKPQMISMFFAMIITSALVSAGTLAGGIWWLTKSGEGLSLTSFSAFLFRESTRRRI